MITVGAMVTVEVCASITINVSSTKVLASQLHIVTVWAMGPIVLLYGQVLRCKVNGERLGVGPLLEAEREPCSTKRQIALLQSTTVSFWDELVLNQIFIPAWGCI